MVVQRPERSIRATNGRTLPRMTDPLAALRDYVLARPSLLATLLEAQTLDALVSALEAGGVPAELQPSRVALEGYAAQARRAHLERWLR